MTLTLYYSPGACSLADHIALHEAGLDHDTVKVDLEKKTTEDGRDYKEINPKGSVPAIGKDGKIFTENAALLQMIAEEAGGKMLPASGDARYRVLEAVAFITTEVHKSFSPLFGNGSESDKAEAKKKLDGKFEQMAHMLGDSDYLAGDEFSIADCYGTVMTLWAKNKGIDRPQSLVAYRDRMFERPSVKAAMKAEGLG